MVPVVEFEGPIYVCGPLGLRRYYLTILQKQHINTEGGRWMSLKTFSSKHLSTTQAATLPLRGIPGRMTGLQLTHCDTPNHGYLSRVLLAKEQQPAIQPSNRGWYELK